MRYSCISIHGSNISTAKWKGYDPNDRMMSTIKICQWSSTVSIADTNLSWNPEYSNPRYDKSKISLQNLVLLCVLIKSSQINSSNFEIWYREGPQKLKILSFLGFSTKNFWIDIQFCRHKLYQILLLFFWYDVSWSKQWPYKKLTTLRSENTQNSI